MYSILNSLLKINVIDISNGKEYVSEQCKEHFLFQNSNWKEGDKINGGVVSKKWCLYIGYFYSSNCMLELNNKIR